jgi:hypothetical protein
MTLSFWKGRLTGKPQATALYRLPGFTRPAAVL